MTWIWTGGCEPPPEWNDLVLCRDIYHCRPSELDEEDDRVVEIHLALHNAELKARNAKNRPSLGQAG